MAYRLLLVEDDNQIREVINDYICAKEKNQFELIVAENGAKGLEFIEREEFDLIMLDVMLPEIDGFSLCRAVRRRSDVPVLFLTARIREEDRLYGYELGCDDYICKPFLLSELLAKINALINRSKGMVVSKEIVCGRIKVNPKKLLVTVDDKEVELPPKEYEILCFLMEHPNWVISRDMLLDGIWGRDYFGENRVVDNHVKKLRKALGTAGNQIKTVISKGYKIVIHIFSKKNICN